jgi:hypothetical protein
MGTTINNFVIKKKRQKRKKGGSSIFSPCAFTPVMARPVYYTSDDEPIVKNRVRNAVNNNNTHDGTPKIKTEKKEEETEVPTFQLPPELEGNYISSAH